MRITVVEDEADIAQVVRDYLAHAGYTVALHDDGRHALAAMLENPPDLAILDIMLPGLNGVDVLRQFRAFSQNPVIMMTARVEEVDRLLALETGADDYVCKPFSPRELVARVKAILRRTAMQQQREALAARLHIDEAQRKARIDGQEFSLTPREFALLRLLAKHPGRVYARSQILQLLYDGESEVTERAIDSHIKNLRRKMAEHCHGAEWIRSVYGVGFALEQPTP